MKTPLVLYTATTCVMLVRLLLNSAYWEGGDAEDEVGIFCFLFMGCSMIFRIISITVSKRLMMFMNHGLECMAIPQLMIYYMDAKGSDEDKYWDVAWWLLFVAVLSNYYVDLIIAKDLFIRETDVLGIKVFVNVAALLYILFTMVIVYLDNGAIAEVRTSILTNTVVLFIGWGVYFIFNAACVVWRLKDQMVAIDIARSVLHVLTVLLVIFNH